MKNLIKSIIYSNLIYTTSANQNNLFTQGPNLLPTDIRYDQSGIANFRIKESYIINDLLTPNRKLTQDEINILKEGKSHLEKIVTALGRITNNKIILDNKNEYEDVNPGVFQFAEFEECTTKFSLLHSTTGICYVNNIILSPVEDCTRVLGYYSYRYIGICIDLLKDNKSHNMKSTLAHEFLHAIGFTHPNDKSNYKISLNIYIDPSSSKINLIDNRVYYKYNREKNAYSHSWTTNITYNPNKEINPKITYGDELFKLLNDNMKSIGVNIDFTQNSWNSNCNPNFQEVNTVLAYAHFDINRINIMHYMQLAINNRNEKEFARLISEYRDVLETGLTLKDIVDIQMNFQGCSKALDSIKGKEHLFTLEACGVDSIKIHGRSDKECVSGINSKSQDRQFVTDLYEKFGQLLKEQSLSTQSETNYQCNPKKSVPQIATDIYSLTNLVGYTLENNFIPGGSNLAANINLINYKGDTLIDANGNYLKFYKSANETNSCQTKLTKSAIAGIAVGSVVAASLLGFIIKKRRDAISSANRNNTAGQRQGEVAVVENDTELGLNTIRDNQEQNNAHIQSNSVDNKTSQSSIDSCASIPNEFHGTKEDEPKLQITKQIKIIKLSQNRSIEL